MAFPYLQKITQPTLSSMTGFVSANPYTFFLDSALPSHGGARYSILSDKPLAIFKEDLASFRKIRAVENFFLSLEFPSELKNTFCGGFLGFATYELGKSLLGLQQKFSEEHLPAYLFALVDTAMVLDHQKDQAYAFSWGLKEDYKSWDQDLAQRRLDNFLLKLAGASHPSALTTYSLEAQLSQKAYLQKIEQAQEALKAGDCYQINLSQKFVAEGHWEAGALYQSLRQHSPAPNMAFINLGHSQILSASPELLLKGDLQNIASYPIKGTAPRALSPQTDQKVSQALFNSPKDRAELLMIVDLVRNDLGKVAQTATVRVENFPLLKSYPQVHHLVAGVKAKLKEGQDCLDAFLALFPGGSITGAPKLKAIEWIDRLEDFARGIYTGSIGYFSANGQAQFNIAIRTALLKGNQLDLFAGGGITVDSDPQEEYEETLTKLSGWEKALLV